MGIIRAIKYFNVVGFLLVGVLFFSSCSLKNDDNFSDVDFSEMTDVQITYNGNVYNSSASYKDGTLLISFKDNNSAVDGITYKNDGGKAVLRYGGLEKSSAYIKNKDNSLFAAAYEFFHMFPGTIDSDCFTKINENEYIIKRDILNYSVAFRVYIRDGINYYSMDIK